MSRATLAALAVAVLVAVAAAHLVDMRGDNALDMAALGKDNTAGDFDFLLLSQGWPGTACQQRQCNTSAPIVPGFLIHGLWPDKSNGQYPQFCDDSRPFNINEIASLVPTMQVMWPGLFSDDTTFWAHEWNKHGTCSAPVFTSEMSYFSFVLGLRQKFDLAGAMAKSGIRPSDSTEVPIRNIQSAVRNVYGVDPMVSCSSVHGSLLINEVWLCFDKTSVQLMDCPAEFRTFWLSNNRLGCVESASVKIPTDPFH